MALSDYFAYTTNDSDMEQITALHTEMIRTIRGLRSKLGQDREMLDNFLGMVFMLLNQCIALDVVGEFANEAIGELRRLCLCAYEKKENSHPFYPALQKYIAKIPCPADDVYIDFYCAGVSLEYARYAIGVYLREQEERIKGLIEMLEAEKAYRRLEKRLGVEEMDEVMKLIIRRFVYVPCGMVFIQCLNDELLFSYMELDEKSGKFLYEWFR